MLLPVPWHPEPVAHDEAMIGATSVAYDFSVVQFAGSGVVVSDLLQEYNAAASNTDMGNIFFMRSV